MQVENIQASKALWGMDWSTVLPLRVSGDIVLVQRQFDEVLPFIGEHYKEIFEQDDSSGFFNEPFDDIKLRYMRTSDVFELRDGDKTIGLIIGAPSDWSTYYLRSFAFLPAYHGQRLHDRILLWLIESLTKAGVRRIELDTSPSNIAVIIILTKLHFNITGQILSERWGALLRLTKYLDVGAEDTFLGKFCSGIAYQKRSHK